jgi:cytochrome P450
MTTSTGQFSPSAHETADGLLETLFRTTEGRRSPYPVYHALRDAAPLYKSADGMWIMSRYDDCWATVRDPRFGKDYDSAMTQRFGPGWVDRPSLESGRRSMLNLNGPPHSRQRKLVSKAFTPRNIGKLQEQVQTQVRGLLAPMAEAGGGCLLDDVAFPLPIAVIGEMLGVPEQDWAQFRPLVLDLTAAFEIAPSPEQLDAADAAQVTLDGYFAELLAYKRKHPDDLLFSRMAETEVDGDRFSDLEVARMAQLLFLAGFETTTNLVGNSMLGFMDHPEQMDLLRRDPTLFENLSDELLRYDGTVQMTTRVTLADVEVAGITIPRGDQVFAMLAAGNHDPDHFDDPDKLDVTRSDVRPLSFGGGAHFCLGAHLARLEIRSVFEELFTGYDDIAFERERPVHRDRLVLRGLESCRLTLRKRSQPRATSSDTVARRAPKAYVPSDRGMRPVSGSGADDIAWRSTLRSAVESSDSVVPTAPGHNLAQVSDLFARQSIFKACTEAELSELAATSYIVSFEPGDLLTAEGAESNECYVIDDGRAVVTIGRKGMGSMGEGDVVGERGVILDKARAATVTATSHMLTYAISRERLRQVVETNEKAREWMQAEMLRRYPDAP